MISMTIRLYRGRNTIPNAKIEYSDGFDPDWTGSDGVAHLQWSDRHRGRKVSVYYERRYLGDLVVKEGGNPWFEV